MKGIKKFISFFAVATMTTVFSATAMAHSSHDHSTVSYKWALSKNLKEKIDNRLVSINPTSVIGLNSFEQKKLERYAIKVGNKFNTEMRGINLLIKRSSAGMRIMGASRADRVAYSGQVPIKRTKVISKASIHKKSHVGHDHSYLPYEWTFSGKTQDKIFQSMSENEGNILIGISKFEQSIFKEYDIKSGNILHTKINDQEFIIEKVSSGIKIISHKELQNVAMAPLKNENL